MVVQRDTTRSWRAVAVAVELAIAESTAADMLERLASGNFLDVKAANEIAYRSTRRWLRSRSPLHSAPSSTDMSLFFQGATARGRLTVGLIFLRPWRVTES
jgi:hypothetical protein